MTLKWHQKDTGKAEFDPNLQYNDKNIMTLKWHENGIRINWKWHWNDTKMTLECGDIESRLTEMSVQQRIGFGFEFFFSVSVSIKEIKEERKKERKKE